MDSLSRRAPAVNPNPPTVLSLPPLLVDAYRDGVYVRTIELGDPRVAFCECFNSLGFSEQVVARPTVQSGKDGAA